MDSQVHNLIMLQLTCFKDVEISNFFCDPSLLLKLACSDIFTKNIVIYFIGAIFAFLPFSGIFYSYYKIIGLPLRLSDLSCILGGTPFSCSQLEPKLPAQGLQEDLGDDLGLVSPPIPLTSLPHRGTTVATQ